MNERYRWLVIGAGIVVALLAFVFKSPAQVQEGMLYGKVTTSEDTYEGLIRWGTEEVLWTDLFNAAKTTDNYRKLVPEQKEEKDSWFNYDWSFSSIWQDKVIAHQFTCQFGYISKIEMLPRKQARITFKNGGELTVSGEGYNDIGTKIQVLDNELGVVSINWERIIRVEFLPTPSRLETVFGTPLYGTVEGIRKEKFTGFIVWDNDERLSTDKLDGKSNDSEMAIAFADIAAIEKQGRGSLVTLKSGREIFLSGSNDVNSGNRGVLVVTPDMGIIKVTWTAFKRVAFSAPGTIQRYQHFKSPQLLRGTVSRLDGSDISGRIIFDIDEALDMELLEGADNDIEYSIPFQLIKRITPKNFDYSTVELVKGDKLLLGGMRDVSSKNGGILVFEKGKKEPTYISWKNVNEIVFNQ